MNSYDNPFLNSQPIFIQDQPLPALDGSTASPAFSSCRCLVLMQTDRDLIAKQRAVTVASNDNAATAIARSKDIEWTGNAAEWFRSTLDRTAYAIKMLTDDMETTQRLAMEA